MEIIEVKSRRQLRQFVIFPDRLYVGCPQYVPALHCDQIHSLTDCASLEYCTHKLWLALDDSSKVCGRISAFINPRYNSRYGKKCCRFGWFDFIEDFTVAKALVETASEWARSQGMNQIHGPLYYNTLGKQGMLVEGFENTPQFNTLYNFPYYVDYVEKMGFVKECDWVQSIIDGYEAPQRLERLAKALMERYKLHYADIETLKKDHDLALGFVQSYSDIFSRSVYNFIPFTKAEMEEEVKQSISMLRNECCSIVMDENGEIAAFGINFPSISKALQKARGSLFPFGWIHLLRAFGKDNDTLDLMLTGVAAKWEGKGLTALLHHDMACKYKDRPQRYFITNPQIETNSAVNVWESYSNRKDFMRRRCYIKSL